MNTQGEGRRVAALVRHGHFDRPPETASAHQLLPLSAEGREQARGGARVLLQHCEAEGLELDTRIETSQLLRAWETAQLIAEELERATGRSFEVVERAELVERGIGSATNLSFDRISELLAADPRLDPLPEGWRRMPDFRLPVLGAESLMDAGRRVAQRIDESFREVPGASSKNLLRVFLAHGGCLRHSAVCLGAADFDVVEGLSMDFVQTILIERGEDAWRMLAGEWKKRLPGT